jgi:hypothetical protein
MWQRELPESRERLEPQPLRTAMVSMLVITWLLAISHCRAEVVPGFEFLRCVPEFHEPCETGHSSDPCENTDCCRVESAQYSAPRQHEILALPLAATAQAGIFNVVQLPIPKNIGCGVPRAAPPELAQCWQFLYRAAPSPRAPSLVID